MATGTIKKVCEKGFGFIEIDNDPRDAFFHASDLVEGMTFDELLTEQRVQFDLVEEAKGARARSVRSR